MRKTNNQSLKEVIEQMLNTYRLKGKLNEVEIINSWEGIVGKMIAKHTSEIYVRNKKLFVHLDSSVVREELSYAREKLLKSLNDVVGEDVITEIVLK